MFSVLILTLDEEINIGDCIASLPWREDVHVLDSESHDRTREIAYDLGAKITEHRFLNYADQRNCGLSLPFTHDWIVMLDADERMTPELACEIEQRVARADNNVTMFSVRRKDIFMGRWLRRSSGYPTWFPRVIRRGRVRVDREINERYLAQGETAQLSGHILHHPFRKGMDWWLDRHNRYSAAEARVISQERTVPIEWSALFSLDPQKRRAILKRLAYRMPARPLLTFIYLYVIRLGFFDGCAGYHYASLRAAYEVMIDAKVAFRRSEAIE